MSTGPKPIYPSCRIELSMEGRWDPMPFASSKSADPARKKLTPQELSAAMVRHKAYLSHQSGGVRAVFKLRDLSHLDLSNLDLSEADFTGAKLFSTRLTNTNLRNATLYGSDLRLANLHGAVLHRADMRGACLRGAILSEADMVEADMRDGTLVRQGSDGGIASVNAEAMKLITELTCATVRAANLSRARVSNAFVMQTDFTDAIL